jgi:hypothetical protein
VVTGIGSGEGLRVPRYMRVEAKAMGKCQDRR